MSELTKLTDDEVGAAVGRELALAKQYTEGTVGDERSLAYDAYYGRYPAAKQKGRSAVVNQVVQETCDGLMPDLVKIFCGGDTPVEFTARGPEDVPFAEQATAAVQYVLQRNDWLLAFYTAAKDALLAKCGVWKYWWDVDKQITHESYSGLTEGDILMLSQDKGIEIVAATPVMGAAEPAFDVTIKRKTEQGFPKIAAVPPEEFHVSPRATSVNPQDIPFTAHVRQMTRSELVEMGYELSVVLELAAGSAHIDTNSEKAARSALQEDGATFGETADPMQEYVEYVEAYICLDVDADGVSELRKVCMVGDTVLHNESTERVPFAVIPYKVMPHEFFAPSLADDVMDLQLLKSQVWRMTMDSLYLSINPRQVVIEGQARLDDVLNPTPGGIIRAKSAGAVMPLEIPFVGAQAQPMLELIEQEIEGRTPVSRYYQGLDPKAVNKTATGMSILTSRNQAQAELVARLWAETGVKWLMEGILWLLSKHQNSGMMVRMRNQYVQVDPRAWTTQYDYSINVGLGTGNKQEQLTMLQTITMAQAQAVQAGGMGLLVEPKHIYNAQAKIVQLAGFKDPAQFWKDPGPEFQPPPEKEPEIVQAEKVKGEAVINKAKVDAGANLLKADKDAEVEERKAMIQAATQLLIAGAKAQADAERMEHERSQAIVGMAMQGQEREDGLRRESMSREDQMRREQIERDDRMRSEQLGPLMEAIASLAKEMAADRQSALMGKEIQRDASGKVVGIRRKA